MFKYVRRELILNKNLIIIFLVYVSVLWIWVSLQKIPPKMAIMIFSFIVPMLSLSLQAREDKFKAWISTCSLPTTRNAIVKARFFTLWIFTFAALFYAVVVSALIPGNQTMLAQLLTLKTLFLSLFFISLCLAVLLPFIIRFGIVGIMIFLVAAQVLGIVFLMLTRLTGRNENFLRSFLNLIIDGIKYLFNHEGTLLFYFTIILAAAALNFFSLKISQFLLARKDF